MDFRDRNRPAPVRVGDELDVTIEAVGEKGDGVAKKDGFVLFVPGVQQGDRVRIRVTKVLRKVGFAEKVGDAGESQDDGDEPQMPDSDSFGDMEQAPQSAPVESESFGEDSEDSEDDSSEDSEEPKQPQE